MAVATGIAPSELLEMDLEIFRGIIDRLAEEARNAQRRHQS